MRGRLVVGWPVRAAALPLAALAALMALTGLAACEPSGSPAPGPASALASADASASGDAAAPLPVASELLEPLQGYPPCTPPSVAPVPAEVRGLVLPEGALVTEVSEDGPITQVTGYVASTPVQARVGYQEDDSITVLQVEDEGFEAEALVESEGRRMFVKIQAVCDEGSVFVALVADAGAAAAIPVPAGSPSPAG